MKVIVWHIQYVERDLITKLKNRISFDCTSINIFLFFFFLQVKKDDGGNQGSSTDGSDGHAPIDDTAHMEQTKPKRKLSFFSQLVVDVEIKKEIVKEKNLLEEKKKSYRSLHKRRPSSVGMYVRNFYGKSTAHLNKLAKEIEEEEEKEERKRANTVLENNTNNNTNNTNTTTTTITIEERENPATKTDDNSTSDTSSNESVKESRNEGVTTAGNIYTKFRQVQLNTESISKSTLSTRDWMWMRTKQSLEIEHEWFAPFFVDHEMGFYTLPSRILVWACVVLGQFVVESFMYNLRYPEHQQNCTVYADFTTPHNTSLGYFDSNGTAATNISSSSSSSSNTSLNGSFQETPFVPMTMGENFILAILVAAISMPLPMYVSL